MIILPDKNIPTAKFLMPIHRKSWMTPSHAQYKTIFGHEERFLFWAIAKDKRGNIRWKGCFEDREDFDIFLHSVATGNIKYDKFIWKLPTPEWNPDFGTSLILEFVTTATLTATTQTTWTLPSDWNNVSNDVHCIGGGGGGGAAARGTEIELAAAGGGGGGYGRYTNLVLSGNPTYQCGATVQGTLQNGSAQDGPAGNDTYFNGTDYTSASVGATGGGGGYAIRNSTTNQPGGAAGTGKGTSSASGGKGGDARATGNNAKVSAGGGGAGGPNGNGVAAANKSANVTTVGDGGAGDNNFGGAGGAGSEGGTAGNGGDGTEWSSSGSGGGGGSNNTGSFATPDAIGGSGGNYGGGGGGATSGTNVSFNQAQGGAGTQGVIHISYTPITRWTNMPMLGM